MSAFRVLVNNPLQESFDITFMEMKKTVKTLIVYF